MTQAAAIRAPVLRRCRASRAGAGPPPPPSAPRTSAPPPPLPPPAAAPATPAAAPRPPSPPPPPQRLLAREQGGGPAPLPRRQEAVADRGRRHGAPALEHGVHPGAGVREVGLEGAISRRSLQP